MSRATQTSAVTVDVRRHGRRFEADAMVDLDAAPAEVWQTITDYEALPEFMPGIQSSRVLERSGARDAEQLIVEQHGEFRFLLFRQLLTVRLQIVHERRRVAHARALQFDLGVLKGRALDAFEGRYEVLPQGRAVRLCYRSLIVSRFPPPPGIGTVAVRKNLHEQLAAVADEVARRTGRRPAKRGG